MIPTTEKAKKYCLLEKHFFTANNIYDNRVGLFLRRNSLFLCQSHPALWITSLFKAM
jgi:hypothetical protein